MPLLTLLIGAALGGLLGHGLNAVVAWGFVGLIAGLVFDAWRKSRQRPAGSAAPSEALDALSLLDPRVAERLRAMERRIGALEGALRGASMPPDAGRDAAPAPAHAPAPPAQLPAGEAEAATAVPDRVAERVPRVAAPAPEEHAAEGAATAAPAAEAAVPPIPAYGVRRGDAVPASPREPSALWRFVTGGNALARVGVVVLFIGVAFLVKYASEHVTIPIEARLAAVALGAVALLALGWRLRDQRSGYAMSLQGAAIAILYLTVFAALRLYQLLPPLGAFALLFWIAALSGFLAVRQDAVALAVLGIAGGFAAPVLASSGSGNHLMLFSYYAVLNAAILGIAWFRAWRVLNVAGFVCTFIVGTLWGVTRYRPDDFATTEPFLVLFFLFYVAIVTLYALRRSVAVRHYVDGTLVFGTPLVVALLQGALVRRIEYAMAWSALGASATYLLLARLLYTRHRDDLRLLVESFLALGVVFATLAVPLALDARLTSATWALEGAALVWVGARQQHLGPRAFGLLLQLAAGVAFALGFSLWTERLVAGNLPILNSDCLGAVLVAGGALVSARVLSRSAAVTATERSLAPVVLAWGVLWWLGAGWREIERFVASDVRIAVLVAFVAVSAAGFAALARRLDWPLARAPALALPVALLLIALYRVGAVTRAGGHPLGNGGWLAWPFALAIQVLLLRHFDRASSKALEAVLDAGHAVLAWVVTLLAAHELAWLARSNVAGIAWHLVPWGLVPALALALITRYTARAGWPFGHHARAYRLIAAVPLVAVMLVYSLYANIASAGDPAPLPFVPLLNPLDLAQGFVLVVVALWLQRLRDAEEAPLPSVSPEIVAAVAAALLLFWVTCTTLRTLHHWADVPWTASGLWTSRIVQTALSIVWSLFALAAMVIANRRRYRVAWVAGAALLAVVVAKLFFVDLSQVGGVERIVSFIGVGVLLLVIGYMAPVPPRQEAR
ncbi:MAG TPA: DUF2339 domain-containing protein [Casimicrobiaceae bacterium]